jgi:hypothetical protein
MSAMSSIVVGRAGFEFLKRRGLSGKGGSLASGDETIAETRQKTTMKEQVLSTSDREFLTT